MFVRKQRFIDAYWPDCVYAFTVYDTVYIIQSF